MSKSIMSRRNVLQVGAAAGAGLARGGRVRPGGAVRPAGAHRRHRCPAPTGLAYLPGFWGPSRPVRPTELRVKVFPHLADNSHAPL